MKIKVYEFTVVVHDERLGRKRSFTFTREGMPRHWKSWVMQQCPYGTNFYGAAFHRKCAFYCRRKTAR
jgi:hypothetical protein